MVAKSGKDELYGIGAVAKLTGLTDHTIRVWERRYGAVVAGRAPNGRRVYTPGDVEKLGLLKQLTDRGISIGQIAGETIAALRERSRHLGDIASAAVPDRVAIAVLGDLLPGQLATNRQRMAPVDVAVSDTNPERFAADLGCQSVDVIVMESPVLDAGVIARVKDYMNIAGAGRGLVVYGFGRHCDVQAARDAELVVLHSPVDAETVRDAVVRAYAPPLPAAVADNPEQPATDWHFGGATPPRRFSSQQLTTLARASTQIDCECPHHLARLVSDLTAFEVYSANCANRDEEDAALHRYLHQTTAEARAQIEAALARVADVEGIDY
jgi:DNA-binding transcriptional MerR regulator